MTTRIVGFTGHPVAEQKSGLAVGMDKGRALTKRELKPKPSYRKGVRAATTAPALGRGSARPVRAPGLASWLVAAGCQLAVAGGSP